MPLTQPHFCQSAPIGPDGFLDLVLHFDTQEVIEAIGTEMGGPLDDGEEPAFVIAGELTDETIIVGYDCVIIRKKGNN